MQKSAIQELQQVLQETGVCKCESVFTLTDLAEVQQLLDSQLKKVISSVDLSEQIQPGKLSSIKHLQHAVEFNRPISTIPELKQTQVFKKARELVRAIQGTPQFYAFDHAIYKHPQAPGSTWHQDQAYKKSVARMRSLHVWIPLHDVERSHGGMQYIPKKAPAQTIQKHTACAQGKILETSVTPQQRETALSWDTPAGSLLIHDPVVIHRSTENHSNDVRKAWILHFSPYGMLEPLLPQNFLYRLRCRFSMPSS